MALSLDGRRAAVTGAGGMLGRGVGEVLRARGAEVVAVPREALDAPDDHLEGVAAVFHLAARTVVADAWDDPAATFEANVACTWRVAAACRRAGVPQMVLASTDQVYGPSAPVPHTEDMPLSPEGPYPASKAAAELVAGALSPRPRVAAARLTNVYGPNDRHSSRLVTGTVTAVLRGRPPVIRGDGCAQRDLLHVDDAAEALVALAEAQADGPYNVGSGVARTVREVVDLVIRCSGADVEPDVRERPPPGEGGRRAVDCARLRRLTGWTPTVDLEDGLRRTIAWYREHAGEVAA